MLGERIISRHIKENFPAAYPYSGLILLRFIDNEEVNPVGVRFRMRYTGNFGPEH
jgi:hypothetical protein